VVVSIEYRLGVLGFLASPLLDAESAHHVSGNYGHLDQIAALAWVQKNIAQFGGDPSAVTIGGQSSGADDVCNLMTSPLASGLFARAIVQSGDCANSVYPALRDAETNGLRLDKDLGIAPGPQSLAALRAVPAERLLATANADDDLDLEPVVDGWVLPEQPAGMYAQGKQARAAVLVGSTENEISIFACPLVGGNSWRPNSVAEYHAWVLKRFGDSAGGKMTEQVFADYPASSDRDARRAFEQMDTDFDFGFGAWLLAQETARAGGTAFVYRFTYVGSGPFAELGAFHAEELMFLSEKYWTTWVARPEDAALSRQMIGYWTQFVKTGDPNGPGLPGWPAWKVPDGRAQELGRQIAPERVPRTQAFGVFQQYLAERLARAGK
jgi:para-nitrobenzyl esterase